MYFSREINVFATRRNYVDSSENEAKQIVVTALQSVKKDEKKLSKDLVH